MTTSTRERRDWTLLIFIIPIGIILMLIAGQIAIRLVPIWSIDAGMQSKLDPNNLPNQQSGVVQPVLPAILTPLGWFDTFLTPGADSGNQNIVFPPFVVFEPSATPAVTLPPPTVATTPPPTIPVTVSPTVVVIPPTTGTQKPPVDGTTAVPTTATCCQQLRQLPTTARANNCRADNRRANNCRADTATATGTPSTPPVTYGTPVTPPSQLGVTPDGNAGVGIAPGTYTIVNLGTGRLSDCFKHPRWLLRFDLL